MGKLITQQVIDALNAGDIPACAAYPGSPMPALTAAAAAVSLYRVDTEKGSATVQVAILCPAGMGGAVCEETALAAMDLLRPLGAKCTQEACGFQQETGLFQVTVKAVFYGKLAGGVWEANTPCELQVSAKGTILTGIVSATTERLLDELTGEPSELWSFRLEEYYTSAEQVYDLPEGCVIIIRRGLVNEQLSDCHVHSYQRIADADSVRIIREGTSTIRTISS